MFKTANKYTRYSVGTQSSLATYISSSANVIPATKAIPKISILSVDFGNKMKHANATVKHSNKYFRKRL